MSKNDEAIDLHMKFVEARGKAQKNFVMDESAAMGNCLYNEMIRKALEQTKEEPKK